MIILYALLFGITMKIADLLDEHGLKWFKGSALLFGLLEGLVAVLLVLSNTLIANILLAMTLAFIIRNRLDYLNHQVAASIIIIAFLFSQTFNPILFLVFYFVFLIFGSLKDYVGDVVKTKKKIVNLLTESMLYYPVPTFIYCLFYGNWIVFGAFLSYTLAYDLTKYVYKKKGYK